MVLTEKQKIILLRICYWYGAILDALWCIPMLIPELGLAAFGKAGAPVTLELRYSLAVGASLMLGWTVLFIWGDRKPVQRKGLLFLTLIPVKICLDLASLLLFQTQDVTVLRFCVMKLDGLILYVLYIFTLLLTRSMKN